MPLLIASLAFMAYRLWPEHGKMDLRLVIGLFAFALFVCCMVCHGELVRLKPHPRHLTGFYVIVSLGGAVGGLFVGLLAPNVFHAYYEFPIGLALCALIAAIVFARALWTAPRIWMQTGISVLVVLLAGYFYLPAPASCSRWWTATWWSRATSTASFACPTKATRASMTTPRASSIHGVINHGQQMLREEYRRLPVTYFCPQSGIGRGMKALEGHPRRIGILGLGCGTLAAYGRPGDTLRIYEINPQVLEIANRDFTYLKDTPAKVEVAMGDARLRPRSRIHRPQPACSTSS